MAIAELSAKLAAAEQQAEGPDEKLSVSHGDPRAEAAGLSPDDPASFQKKMVYHQFFNAELAALPDEVADFAGQAVIQVNVDGWCSMSSLAKAVGGCSSEQLL